MRFASLGSGSKGNGTLVEDQHSCVMIDCGFSVRETERRLKRLNRSADDLTAILVTHEHGDHIRGVLPLAKKYSLPVFMTAGTAKTLNHIHDGIELIDSERGFKCGSFEVTPVAVPHDAREPVQFVLRTRRHALGVLTDLGTITPHVVEQYFHCDGLLLESNHDCNMLANGPYPPALKRRVGGDWGHLNNGQAAGLLSHLQLDRMQQLVLGHISEQNNSVSLVRETMAAIEAQLEAVHYACQDKGFGWLELQ